MLADLILSTYLLACLGAAPPLPHREQAVTQFVEKVVVAHGGDLLAQRRCCFLRLKGTFQAGRDVLALDARAWYRLPGMLRMEHTHQSDRGERSEAVAVYNREGSWMREGGHTTETRREVHPPDLANYVTLLPLRDDPTIRLTLLPARTDQGRKLVGLRLKERTKAPVSLFFDEKTYLLTLMEYDVAPIQGIAVRKATRFSDYRKVDGILIPMKRIDQAGPFRTEVSVQEVKHFKVLDPKLFEKP